MKQSIGAMLLTIFAGASASETASGTEFWPFDGLIPGLDGTPSGYKKHSDHACSGKHELYIGTKKTLAECAAKCESFSTKCSGFEFFNAKHAESGKCQVSTSCTEKKAKQSLNIDFYAREVVPHGTKRKAESMLEEQKPQPQFDDDSMTFIRRPDKEQAKKPAKQAEPKKAEEKTGTTLDPTSQTTSTSSVGVTLENLEGMPGTTPGSAAVKGDPHLQNVKGQAFDVMQTGNMLLLEIPRGSSPEMVNLNMRVDIDYLGAVQCGPTFITNAYLTGRWLGRSVDFRSGPIAKKNGKTPKKTFGIRLDQKEWIPHAEFDKSTALSKDATIATVERKFLLKVGTVGIAVSQPKRPRVFLDVQVKGLQNLDVEIGGLLGVDDHSAVEQEPSECKVTATRV